MLTYKAFKGISNGIIVGSKVAFTLAASNLVPDGKLYIWDIESDEIAIYDFQKYGSLGDSNFDGYYEDGTVVEITDESDSNTVFDEICKNRIPMSMYWCEEDPRLLICNARKIKKLGDKKYEVLGKNGQFY